MWRKAANIRYNCFHSVAIMIVLAIIRFRVYPTLCSTDFSRNLPKLKLLVTNLLCLNVVHTVKLVVDVWSISVIISCGSVIVLVGSNSSTGVCSSYRCSPHVMLKAFRILCCAESPSWEGMTLICTFYMWRSHPVVVWSRYFFV